MSDTTLYQYNQKMVLFRNNGSEILLAKRKGEADYDGTYSFTGGKLETTDQAIIEGLRREKDEEIGVNIQVSICPHTSYNVYFVKSSGQHMIVAHYYTEYLGGEIEPSDEYADYKWIPMEELQAFEPKVENIYEIALWAQNLKKILKKEDMVTI
jgi:8-oxo-dGTP pyrophosphatase MutT (NUDIX family)